MPAQSQNQAPDKDGQSTLFGAKPAKASSSSAAPGIGVFASAPKPASSTPAEPGASSSAAGPSEPAPNLLRGKTLEDIVDGWNKDLDSQVKEFERQAGEVREWDKVLVRNGNQVSCKDVTFR